MLTEPEVSHRFALDCETFLINAENGLTPPWVCMSAAWRDDEGKLQTALFGSDEAGAADCLETLYNVLQDDDVAIVGARLAYDMAVLMVRFPELTSLIFEKYAKQLCIDVQLSEKLLNLSSHGRVDRFFMPDGKAEDIVYALHALASSYFEGNRADQKKGDDIWRLNYEMLHGMPAAEYPREAADYALADAVDALRVDECQRERERTTHGTMFGTRHKAAVDFAYHLVSVRGIANDQDYIDYMARQVEVLAAPEKLPLLVEEGFLIPAQPPKPHARAKDHVAGCKRKPGCGCPPAMCKPQPEKIATKKFRAYVAGVCLDHGRDIKLTKTGKRKFKVERIMCSEWSSIPDEEIPEVLAVVATSSEVIDVLAPLDPVIEEFQRRSSVQKIKQDNEKITGARVTHPSFDTLKETTRTSSYHSSNIPSRNIQQVAKGLAGMDPRRAHKPRDGYVFIDSDYQALELCQVAQTTYTLFRHSTRCVHREKINQGYDLHCFLGSQLALRKSPEFGNVLQHFGAHRNEDEVYRVFRAMKTEGSEELLELFQLWRTFAKPTGLGFPGGLGPATMVDYAAKTFGVAMTVDEAREFREFWRELYVEMPEYFDWCNDQLDTYNDLISKADDDMEDDAPSPAYWYQTPFGVTRRGARFCALANGKAMQSPAAEGFNLAMFQTQRECYDPAVGSPLLGSGVVVPLHDQIVLETRLDDIRRVRGVAARLQEIMEGSMSVVCPDVKVSAEPFLCSRWSKSADEVRNDQGELEVWHPKDNPHLQVA